MAARREPYKSCRSPCSALARIVLYVSGYDVPCANSVALGATLKEYKVF